MTPWTVAHQASLSPGFSGQEYWRGFPFLLQGIVLTPGIKPSSLTSPALAGWLFTTSATWEALCLLVQSINSLEGFYKKQFIFIYLHPLHIIQCLMQRRVIIKLFLFFINKTRPAGTSFLHENNCSSRVLLWTSLVVQYIRIRLPVTGTQVRSLVWEDSTCHGATKARGPQLLSLRSGACAVQREKPQQ